MHWPNGIDAIKATYGDPDDYYLPDGSFDAARWERERMMLLILPRPLLLLGGTEYATRVMVHRLVAPSLALCLDEIDLSGEWEGLEQWGGCYNRRFKRRPVQGMPAQRSVHFWAAAIDPGADRFPQGSSPAGYPQPIVEIFESRGWIWGGRWRGALCDPAHFQACEGY